MNPFKFPLSTTALAARLFLSFALANSAFASLSDHPEPARLDTGPQAPRISPSLIKTSVPAPVKAESATVKIPSIPVREEILSLARRGLLDSAFAAAKNAFASAPDDPFILLMMGKLSPDGKASAEYFRKAAKAGDGGPEAEESLFRLGQFHYAAGKYYLAIPCFRDYLRLFPTGDWKEPAAYWMGHACLSLAQGRPEKSAYLDSGEVWFQKLLGHTKPDDYYHALALEGLAKAKAAKSDRTGALEAAQSALAKAPQEEQSPLLLFAAQLNNSVDRQAEKRLMARLVSDYPQSPEARYLRKLNAGVDTSRWKSGSALPRPAPAVDSLTVPRASDSLKRADETSALPPLPPPAGQKAYTLQLGAFSQAVNAQAMMANLVKAGLTPELVESIRSGKKIFQVRLGRFATSDEAAEYARTTLKPLRLLSQPVPVNP